MANTIYCLVDDEGSVFTMDGADSYEDVAASCGLHQDACQQYRYDLGSRRLVVDRGTPSSDAAVTQFLDEQFGSAERLMLFAEDGHLPKDVLAATLDSASRERYVRACAEVEHRFTADCRGTGDPCLASGCSVDDEAGETCLQPLLRAPSAYNRACAIEWIKLFRDRSNRIGVWRN